MMCSCILLLFCTVGNSQVWTTAIKGGITYSQVIDKEFSALPFKGVAGVGALLVKYQRPRVLHAVSVYYTSGALKPAVKEAGNVSQSLLIVAYAASFRVSREDAAFHFSTGGSLDFLHADRKYSSFINKNKSYEYAVSAAPVLELSYAFKGRSAGWSIADRCMIPVAATTGLPTGNGKTTWQFSGPLADWTRIRNQVELSKDLNKGQQFSVTYGWDYYRIRSRNEVIRTDHQLTIGYAF